MNTRVIPKETNYQKWLNDYKIHCNSEDVIIGNIYKGYAVIDRGSVHSKCRTIYYDAGRRIRLPKILKVTHTCLSTAECMYMRMLSILKVITPSGAKSRYMILSMLQLRQQEATNSP